MFLQAFQTFSVSNISTLRFSVQSPSTLAGVSGDNGVSPLAMCDFLLQCSVKLADEENVFPQGVH